MGSRAAETPAQQLTAMTPEKMETTRSQAPAKTQRAQSCKVVLKELRPQDPCTTLRVGAEDPMIVLC